MLRVGLTGGIGSGKSTVSARLAELGAVILDADQAARAVVEPGTPGLAAITAAFGAGVLAADGSLDRARLAGIVCADEAALGRLNAITHPLIHAWIGAAEEAAIRAGGDDVVLVPEVALLAECGGAAQPRAAAGGGRHRDRQLRVPRGPGPAGGRGLARAAGPFRREMTLPR